MGKTPKGFLATYLVGAIIAYVIAISYFGTLETTLGVQYAVAAIGGITSLAGYYFLDYLHKKNIRH